MGRRPFTAIPAVRSDATTLKAKQRLVLGLLLAAVLAGPLALVVASRSRGASVAVPDPYPTPVVAFASLVAADYLAGRPTTLPAAPDVDPSFGGRDGDDPVPFPNTGYVPYRVTSRYVQTSRDVVQVAYSTTFRVRGVAGELYDLTITTGVDRNNLSVLVAQPSLTRSLVAAPESGAPLDYDDLPTAIDVGPGTRDAVARWADAYAADDRSALAEHVNGAITDGTVPTGVYVGVGGYTAQATITKVVPITEDVAYGRVRVLFSPASAQGPELSNEFDVLVRRYRSSDPRVVAWGVPGTGPELQPFANNTAYQTTTR